jgi:hypothetical protein
MKLRDHPLVEWPPAWLWRFSDDTSQSLQTRVHRDLKSPGPGRIPPADKVQIHRVGAR